MFIIYTTGDMTHTIVLLLSDSHQFIGLLIVFIDVITSFGSTALRGIGGKPQEEITRCEVW